MNNTEFQKNYYPNLKQSIFLSLRLILVSIIVLIPFVILILSLKKNDVSQYPIIESLLQLVGYVIPFATICLFAIKRIKHLDFPDFKLNLTCLKPVNILVLVIMTFALMIVIEPFSNFIPMPEFIKKIFADMADPDIFSFITLVIAAPILEEIFFRGIILEGLLKNHSPVKAIIWSALIFGLVHLNPWQAIGATLSGVFIGWIYWKTKSILPGIIIHFTNNLIGFLASNLTNSKSESIIQLINNNTIYILLLLILIIVLFFGYKILSKSLSPLKEILI